MKVGLRVPYGLGAELLRKLARAAEKAGYESLWCGDHLVLPKHVDSVYPYGRLPVLSHRYPIHDSAVLLAHLAAVTERIRLGIGVHILPLRSPFVTASAIRTLDVLSGGRAILGVGVGWLKEEFEVVGQRFVNRGRRTDECLTILRKLWTESEPAFTGQFYSFPAVGFEPKPIQRPHPPIIIGGESDAALLRAARFGDGWYAHSQDLAEIERKLVKIQQVRERENSSNPFEVTVRVTPLISVDDARRHERIGVARLVLGFGDANLAGAEVNAQNVLSKVQASAWLVKALSGRTSAP